MSTHNLAEQMKSAVLDMGASGSALNIPGTGYLFNWGPTVPSDAATGYASSAIFLHTDAVGDSDVLYINQGDKDSANFDTFGDLSLSSDLASTANGVGASLVGIEDAGAFTSAATAEAALAEVYQHLLSTQNFMMIPLHAVRETTSLDVGAITANGGLLASDTTPVLDAINAATDGCQRILWAASNSDQVTFQTPLPPDLDVSSNIVLHMRGTMGGATDTPTMTLASYFNEADTAVADTSSAFGNAYAEETATIAAADIPAGAQTLTVGLTPGAHTTDTLAVTAIWLEYTKVILTS